MRLRAEDLPPRLRAQLAAQVGPPPAPPAPKPVIACVARVSASLEPEMNKTERAFADWLEDRKRRGLLAGYRFEAMTLRLAPRTSYTPDFMVWEPSGELLFYEVKGFWRDDARVKIKVAAAAFPFRFIAVTRRGKEWAFEPIPSA